MYNIGIPVCVLAGAGLHGKRNSCTLRDCRQLSQNKEFKAENLQTKPSREVEIQDATSVKGDDFPMLALPVRGVFHVP